VATAGADTQNRQAVDAHRPGARFAAWTGDRAGPLIVSVGLCMIVAYVAAVLAFPKPGGRILFGDATHHFVQLRSLVFDGDLNFRNEYVRLYNLRGGEVSTEWVTTELTATGHVRNYMPLGPALLWAPAYLLLAAVQTLLAWLGLAAPPDGFDRMLQLAPGITGIVAATLAVLVSWRLARRYAGPAGAAIGAMAAWFGSSAIYYSLVSPTYSHAASMLASAVLFSFWLGTFDRPSLRRAAVLGALAGVAALMRWQDAIFLCIPILDAVGRRAGWRVRAAHAGAASIAFVLAFSPQMMVWHVLYGAPLAVPQGPSFLQWTAPHLGAVLLSDNHGLFVWTPLVVLSIAGLGLFLWRRRELALPIAVVVIASWYVNAAVADWWAGEAFGARRFLSLFPLFVVGLAVWLCPRADRATPVPRIAAGRLAVAVVLVVLNLLLLFQYQLFMKGLHAIAPYPRGWFDMWLARLVVPFRFLAWWLG